MMAYYAGNSSFRYLTAAAMSGMRSELMVQVCIFRNAVRRALKGISQALERLEGGQAGAGGTVQVCRAVTTVLGQIAQSVHRMQQVAPSHACWVTQTQVTHLQLAMLQASCSGRAVQSDESCAVTC